MRIFELCAFQQLDLYFRQAVEVIDEAVDLRVRGGNLAVQRGLLVRGFSPNGAIYDSLGQRPSFNEHIDSKP